MNKGVGFVMITALVSGFSIFINKFGVEGIDAYLFTGMKNIVVAALLVLLILFLKESKHLRKLNIKELMQLVAIGFVGGSVPFLLFFKGLSMTSAANAAFIHKTLFIFASLFAFLFLKERISRADILLAGMLLAGNVLLLSFVWKGFGIGDLIVFIATLFWAGEITISKKALVMINPRVVALGRMFFGFLFIFIFWVTTGTVKLVPQLGLAELGWIAVTALLLFLYVGTFYTGLREIKVSVATSILLLGSVVTSLLSLVFADAMITAGQITGMMLLIGGVGLLLYAHGKVQYVWG